MIIDFLKIECRLFKTKKKQKDKNGFNCFLKLQLITKMPIVIFTLVSIAIFRVLLFYIFNLISIYKYKYYNFC